MANVLTPRVFFALDELVTCTGDLVAIRSRRLYLTPEQALELSGKLETFAQRLIERRATEKNRNLPISEALSLSLGDSCDQGTPAAAKTVAGEIPLKEILK